MKILVFQEIHTFQKMMVLISDGNCKKVVGTDISHHQTIKKARQTSDMFEMVSHVRSAGAIDVDMSRLHLLSTSQCGQDSRSPPPPVKTWILGNQVVSSSLVISVIFELLKGIMFP